MTDKEVYIKYKRAGQISTPNYIKYLKTIPTNDLFQYFKYNISCNIRSPFSAKELRSRSDAPDEIKLEMMLIICDY